jgi:hypothetical protein
LLLIGFGGGRGYLEPESWTHLVSRQDAFVCDVFHELLHVWVDENINKSTSAMLAKYQSEDSDTCEHLHLMAIQKMVYFKIGRQDMVEMIDQAYRNFAPASYRRAWEIVSDIEGNEAVLQDITANLYPQYSATEL